MNPCTEAAPVHDPNGEDRWLNQHKKFIRQSQDSDPEVLFLGDSLIQYMQLTSTWLRWFVPMHSLNFGIGGDQTQHLLWRVLNGELDYCKPKAVVILVGTNNISNSAEQIADGIMAVAQAVRDKLPQTYIVIMNLLPRGKTPNPHRVLIEEVNNIVKSRAASIEKCEFIVTGQSLVQPNGEIDHHDMFDYLHLTASGYEKVFEPVNDLLTQLLAENEPEPDLDKILLN